VAVSHDGAWVVSGSKDRSIQFWDSRSAIVQCILQGHKNSGEFFYFILFCGIANFFLSQVISTDLSPAGSILATGSGDWQARICTSAISLLFEE
jgi:general transcriptional corepressor TUP1